MARGHLSLDSRKLQKAHAIREDSDQTARVRRLLRVFADRTSLIVVLSCSGSNILG